MEPLHIILIVCAGVLFLFIMFVVCIRISNKKRFNRLQANLKKLEQEKEDFENDKSINFEDVFAEIDQVAQSGAVVEDYVAEEDKEPQQEEIKSNFLNEENNLFEDEKRNFSKKSDVLNARKKRDKEFEEFLNQHAYSRKILDKNLLDKLKTLPPELKETLLNSMFEKFDN